MGRKTIYLPIEEFESYLKNGIKGKNDFTVETTGYTRKIKTEDTTFFFNPDGKGDFRILNLIRQVRIDAALFCNHNTFVVNDKIKFFDLIDKPPSDKISVTKVDITAAYWTVALRLGIISEKSDKYLQDNFEPLEKKYARLKALGSLATRKEKTTYVNGKYEDTSSHVEKTRELYLFICQQIDELMQNISWEVTGAFYYYWDCIFVTSNASKDVVELVKNAGYTSKSKKTRIYLRNDRNMYWLESSDKKIYTIREEQNAVLWQ